MTTTRHAELGASKTERWMHCPGSVAMCRTVPDVDTPYAAEGRKAHAAAEKWLLDGVLGTLSDGTAIDDEMRDVVRVYVDYVRALAEGKHLDVEVTFDLAALKPPQPMYGTADAVITGGRRLDVVDFKYGAGVPVEVNGNTQLLYYVVGALTKLGDEAYPHETGEFTPQDIIEGALGVFDEVWVHIVQPRAPHADGPIRTASISHLEVREFVTKLMLRAAATLDPLAPLHAGTWCRFCPAHAHCPEVQRYAVEVARTDFDVVTPPAPDALPLPVVADILTKVHVLETWFTALRARVAAELAAGREVRGWKLVAKRAQRVWNNAEEVTKWAAAVGLTTSEILQTELKSPAQVEKVVGKAHLPTELYSSISTGLTLAPAADPRPAAAIGPQSDFPALPPGSLAADIGGIDL